MVATVDFRPGDVLLYHSAANIAFQGLAWAQRIAGLRDAPFAHIGMISRVDPRGTWADEISAYTDSGVRLTAKYPWPCRVLRFSTLDTDKALAFATRFLGQCYGWPALLWMGIYRKIGIRSLALPRWTGWEHVCSPLIAGALRAGGVDLSMNLDTSLIMPSDFSNALGADVLGEWVPT